MIFFMTGALFYFVSVQPLIKARDLLKFPEWLGSKPVRMKGSHVRLKAEDRRDTTAPIHGNKEIPIGLLL